MRKTFAGIVEAMGGTLVERNRSLRSRTVAATEEGISVGGEIIHEVGTTRMGTSPRTSVLNEWCQAHDAKNVFVADAGPFVSNAHKNCTWTILALSMRTAEHIAEERKRGNL
jgi:choline dehydrogenase-like flavoprotein